MKTIHFATLTALIGAALLVGCATQDSPAAPPAETKSTTQPVVAAAAPTPAPTASGAQLWADNCSRCHNIRPPQSYNDAQWEAVVMHMRLRANLTGPEQREITRFMQASH